MQSILSRNSIFSVNGKWGINPNKMDNYGMLIYDNGSITLQCDKDLAINKNSSNGIIYGTGVINVRPDKDTLKFKTEGSIFVTLKDTIVRNKVGGFKNIDGKLLATTVITYSAMRMFVGDQLVLKNSSFKKMEINLTNFSNWLSSDATHSALYHNASQPTIELKNEKNKETVKVNQVTYGIGFSYKFLQNVARLSSRVTGFKMTNSIFALNNGNVSQSQFLKIPPQILAWYSLLSGNDESIYKIKLSFKDSVSQVDYFEFNQNGNTRLREYSFINAFSQRNSKWIKSVMDSLKLWISEYDKLAPVFFAINPPSSLKLEYQLQSSCVAVQTIARNFYEESNLKHHRPFRKELRIIFSHIDNGILKKALEIYPQEMTVEDLVDMVIKYRNPLSHDYVEAGHQEDRKQVYLNHVLKALIREWLLVKIGIPRYIIDEGYEIDKTFSIKII